MQSDGIFPYQLPPAKNGLLMLRQCLLILALVSLSIMDLPSRCVAAEATPIKVGAASIVITPPLGSWVQAAGAAKRGDKILDEMEANVLYLEGGETKMLFISCDLVALERPITTIIREAISKATGVPDRSVLIACTHQHSGPVLMQSNPYMPVDVAYQERLHHWLVEASEKAVASARPGKLAWGKGSAAIGFNRRVCWADGTHSMHGNTQRADFAGLEGPDDHQHLALFAVDAADAPVAVLHHNTSHPTNYYAAGVFSSDYPGFARKLIRAELGEIPVLYFNGAQGDIAIQDQLSHKPESAGARVKRVGALVAEETMRLRKEAVYHDQVQLGHEYKDLQVAVRLPEPADLAAAQKTMDDAEKAEKQLTGMEAIFSFGVVDLQRRFGENPVDILPVHVFRIGDVALVSEPCELYCQFGIDMKRRSPTPFTAVIGLADGYAGYCPTIAGILGGGYSGRPIRWTRLEPYAGYKMVEAAGPMLNRLWREKP
jgi:hypothetical protein